NQRIDELLGDVAVGSCDVERRSDAHAPAVTVAPVTVTMATMHMSGSGGWDQSGGTNRNGGTKGESEFAEHDGSPVSRTLGCSGCDCHILNLGRWRAGKGSKPPPSVRPDPLVSRFIHAKKGSMPPICGSGLPEPRPKRGNW